MIDFFMCYVKRSWNLLYAGLLVEVSAKCRQGGGSVHQSIFQGLFSRPPGKGRMFSGCWCDTLAKQNMLFWRESMRTAPNLSDYRWCTSLAGTLCSEARRKGCWVSVDDAQLTWQQMICEAQLKICSMLSKKDAANLRAFIWNQINNSKLSNMAISDCFILMKVMWHESPQDHSG